ncbi:MAG: pyrimidine-nucleoside phosphorylase, partial [Bacteroidota bacterium]
GFVAGLDAFEIGQTSIMLGAGRQKLGDILDPKAGILLRKKTGSKVETGDVLAEILTDREEVLSEARERLRHAYRIANQPPEQRPLIHSFIDNEGVHPWISQPELPVKREK